MSTSVDPLAPEEPDAGAPPPRGRLTAGGRVIVAIALVFLLGPPLLALVHRGSALPRERVAAAPRPGRGWEALDATTRYLVQRLPGRARAVDANTWISRHVFGTTPRYGSGSPLDAALPFGLQGGRAGYAQSGGAAASHPIVATGRDGWLFLQGELDITCKPPIDPGEAARRWTRLVGELRASGRRVVLVVVPEKSTIYPQFVAPSTASWPCAERQKARIWQAIEAVRDPDVVGLRRHLTALEHRDPRRLTYLPGNSHWNELGALEMVRAALRRVGGPVQVRDRDVHVAPKAYPSDLAAFAGLGKRNDIAPGVTIVRPGIRDAGAVRRPYGATTDRTGPPGSLLAGSTLMLHDSFGFSVAHLVEPYARHLVLGYFPVLKPAQLPGLIRAADTVILETSERDFLNRAAPGLDQTILTPAFLRDLPAALPRPARAPGP